MSEYLDRAAARLIEEDRRHRGGSVSGYVTDEAVDVAARVIHEYLDDAYDHEAAVAMTRAALRAYQAPREWGEADTQRLPVGALFVDERGHVYRLGAHGLLFPPGSSVGSPTYTLGPLRLVYNPDDLKEN